MEFFSEKNYLKPFFGIVSFSLIAAFFEGLSFHYLYEALAIFDQSSSLFQESAAFEMALFLSVFLQMFRALGVLFSSQWFARLSTKMQGDLQKALSAKLFSFSYPYFSKKKIGIFADIFGLPSACFSQVFSQFHALCHAAIFFLVLLGFMFCTSISLSFVTLFVFVFIGIFYRFFSKKTGKKSYEYSLAASKLQANMAEKIYGINPSTFNSFFLLEK